MKTIIRIPNIYIYGYMRMEEMYLVYLLCIDVSIFIGLYCLQLSTCQFFKILK